MKEKIYGFEKKNSYFFQISENYHYLYKNLCILSFYQ